MKKIVSHLQHGTKFWAWMLVLNTFIPAFLIIPFYAWKLPIGLLVAWLVISFILFSILYMNKCHRLEDAEQIYFAKGELLNETNN